MQTLCILGLGLMGGSLGLAARKTGVASRVKGYARRPESLQEALKMGAIDEAYDSALEAARDADIVVLCVPILSMSGLLESCKPVLDTGCIVTDVGSTKGELVASAESILADSPASFVGSHPMAGSEQTGLDAARADLYADAVVIVTGSEGSDPDSVKTIAHFWRALGSNVCMMNPNEHDEIIAKTSHLPHLVASVLVNLVLERDADTRRTLCARGFRDTTRVAAGSEDMWHDIVRTNSNSLADEVRAMIRKLEQLVSWMEVGDYRRIRDFLAESRELRESLNED